MLIVSPEFGVLDASHISMNGEFTIAALLSLAASDPDSSTCTEEFHRHQVHETARGFAVSRASQ